MNLLEELKQRTIEKKSVKEYEERNQTLLDEYYEIYLDKIKGFADSGFSECHLNIRKESGCAKYVMDKLKENGLIISNIKEITTKPYLFERLPDLTYIEFKVRW